MHIRVEVHTSVGNKDVVLSQDFNVEGANAHDERFIDFQEKMLEHYRSTNPDWSIDCGGSENSVDFDFCDGFVEFDELRDLEFIFFTFEKEFGAVGV